MNIVVTIENFQNSIYDLNISIYDHKPRLKGKRVSGLKFAMIRDKINNSSVRSKNSKIFVHLGSTESKKKLYKLIPFIKKIRSNNLIDNVYFITKFYREFSYLNDKFIKFKSKNKFLYYFKICNFHIVNTGVTTLESIFLKKLFVSLPQNKQEKIFSNYLKKKNKNLLIGLYKIKNKNLLNTNLLNTNKLIDSKGYQRIYRLIKSLRLSRDKKRFAKIKK